MKEYRASRVDDEDLYNFDDINDDLHNFEDKKHSKTTYDIHIRPKANKGRAQAAQHPREADLVTPPKTKRQLIDIDTAYSALNKDQDTNNLEKNPLVLAYEQRNQIRKHKLLSSEIAQRGSHKHDTRHCGYIHDHLPDINPRNVLKHDTRVQNDMRGLYPTHIPSTPSKPDVHTRTDVKSRYGAYPFDESICFTPAPPTTAKPHNRSEIGGNQRRRKLYRSNQLDQDIAVHNPSVYHTRPRTPVVSDIDYEKEIRLATAMQEEFDSYHQALDEIKMSLEEHNGSFAHALSYSSSHQMLNTASNTPFTASTNKPTELRRPWDASNARRGVGYSSKVKKQEIGPQKIDDSISPQKIRRQIKNYYI